jgi:aldose 1-epimerase
MHHSHESGSLHECLPSGTTSVPGDEAGFVAESGIWRICSWTTFIPGLRATDGRVTCRMTDPAARLVVEQRCSGGFREIVAFTPPWATAVCLEPYTCVTDAINLQQKGIDAGLQVLPPGEAWDRQD